MNNYSSIHRNASCKNNVSDSCNFIFYSSQLKYYFNMLTFLSASLPFQYSIRITSLCRPLSFCQTRLLSIPCTYLKLPWDFAHVVPPACQQ